jgi:hypothetical protein
MSQVGRQRAIDNFSWEIVTENLLHAYQEMP